MSRGVHRYLVGSAVLAALAAVAGCGHYMFAEREPWRHDAEVACLNSGAVPDSPGRVRISAISGPGICGMDYPIKVTELGESGPLGYTDEPLLPPSPIPDAGMPPQLSTIQSNPLPPPQAEAPYPPSSQQPYGAAPAYGRPQYGAPPYGAQPYGSQPYDGAQAPAPYPPPPQSNAAPYGQPQYGAAQYGAYGGPPPAAPQDGAPMSLSPPSLPPDETEVEQGEPTQPYSGSPNYTQPPRYGAPNYGVPNYASPNYAAPNALPPAQAPAANAPIPPLGPPAMTTASAGPVAVRPAATLACPIVAELDKWISEAVQPAALKWFRQPVVEIKQISSYSCRGMNGNPNAHISEHAFGNALDIAEFDLADGHRISVQYGWHGSPEEQGFLRDVQGAACSDFTTVLAPGANVYHYNHIHVDLMRRAHRRFICEPSAMPGEVAAARARYAAHGEPRYTGSLGKKNAPHPLGYVGDDDHLPLAVPGED